MSTIGDAVVINASTSDNIPVASRRLRIGGADVPLASTGNATYHVSAAGIHDIEATALDPSGKKGRARDEFDDFEPVDTTPPVAAFQDPKDAPTAMLPTEIVGTASDANDRMLS